MNNSSTLTTHSSFTRYWPSLFQAIKKVEGLQSRGPVIAQKETALRNDLEQLKWRLDEPSDVKARLNELSAIQKMQVRTNALFVSPHCPPND